MKRTFPSPIKVKKLEDNDIFVFESTLHGHHYVDNAKIARNWGAEMGQGIGLYGQTYAIPTGGINVEVKLIEIKSYIDDFVAFAKLNSELRFLVTDFGGKSTPHTIEQIAPLFIEALEVENIYLPLDILKLLNKNSGLDIVFTGEELDRLGISGYSYYPHDEYVVPDGFTVIKSGAFSGCCISNISLPCSVTKIEEYAFSGSTYLNYIDTSCVVFIGDGAFSNCGNYLMYFNIGSSVETIGAGAFANSSSIQEFTVSKDNKFFTAVDGVLFNKMETSIIAFPNEKVPMDQFPEGSNSREYIIPKTVEIIEESAFEGCDNLASVVIPDSVISIKDYAFDGCEYLESVILPDSVKSVGKCVFNNCDRLTSILVSSSNPIYEQLYKEYGSKIKNN